MRRKMKTICGTILLAALQFAAFGATYKVDVDSPSGVYSCGETAALGMDRNEHLFSRYGEWRRGKFVAGGFGAEIVRLV